jgi:dTDP-4-dehydrorhamnose reductase
LKILLIGSKGQVGRELSRTLPTIGELCSLDRSMVDLRDSGQIRGAIRKIRPRLIVNAAAYTDVERAESERDTVYQVNAVAPAVMADEAQALGAAMVHYSTDYVFAGEEQIPYIETDPPRPLNFYAETKLKGEQAVALAGVPHLVLRVSWVFGAADRGFVPSILRRALNSETMRVVDDQIGVPTWSRRIANVTTAVLQHLVASGPIQVTMARVSGVYHCASSGSTTRADFAERVLALAGIDVPRLLARVPTSAYPASAIRPPYSVLDSSRLKNVFGIVMPSWYDDLAEAVPGILGALEKERSRT